MEKYTYILNDRQTILQGKFEYVDITEYTEGDCFIAPPNTEINYGGMVDVNTLIPILFRFNPNKANSTHVGTIAEDLCLRLIK